MVEIAKFAHVLKTSPSFVKRTFSAPEVMAAENFEGLRRQEFLAGRFAVKEAVLKALQIGIADPSYLNYIDTASTPNGAPKLNLCGPIALLAEKSGLSDWQVSISHEAGVATAFVLLS